MAKNLNELKEWLQANGFRIASNPLRARENECHWYAYRSSQLAARECECNDGKPAQIVIEPYAYELAGSRHESVEIGLKGQYGVWWSMSAYGLKPQEVQERLADIERSLIGAWNALASPSISN